MEGEEWKECGVGGGDGGCREWGKTHLDPLVEIMEPPMADSGEGEQSATADPVVHEEGVSAVPARWPLMKAEASPQREGWSDLHRACC